MTSITFDWDAAKAAGNRRKHGVTFDEASAVFMDGLCLSIRHPARAGEEAYLDADVLTVSKARAGVERLLRDDLVNARLRKTIGVPERGSPT